MKKLIAIYLSMSATVVLAGGTVQRVCHVQKGHQVCKNIKVHKKFDGTAIPPTPIKKKK